jgi:hypothetical protein
MSSLQRSATERLQKLQHSKQEMTKHVHHVILTERSTTQMLQKLQQTTQQTGNDQTRTPHHPYRDLQQNVTEITTDNTANRK